MKTKAIICDLDGTLADCSHRLHHIQGEKKDWKSFNALVAGDTVNDWCREIVLSLAGKYTILFTTGRMGTPKTRQETIEWIQRNVFPGDVFCGWKLFFFCDWLLFARPAKDYRPDWEVKQEMYLKEIKRKYDILFCIDDRQQVVDMWRKNGLVCLQCAKGDY